MTKIASQAIGVEDDQIFFLRLYEKNRNIMFRTVYRYIEDTTIAEDIIQDCLLKLIPKISHLKELDEHRQSGYIVYTVRNSVFNYCRDLTVEKKYLIFEEMDDFLYRLHTSERYVEDAVEYDERIVMFRTVLSQLPERDQEILIKKYILLESDEDIASELGCKRSSVRMMLTRARRRGLELFREVTDYEFS